MDAHFKNPPVVERIISLQFDQIPGFTNAHAGWFWKSSLDEAWSTISEAAPIQEVKESFTNSADIPQAQFQFLSGPVPNRLQIVRKSDDRMIQLQNSRFILNWRSKDNQEYPDFEKLLSEHEDYFSKFCKFAKSAGLNDINLNQWEVTYVNHIPNGTLWSTFADWTNLFPGLSLPNIDAYRDRIDALNTSWAINLGNNAGRLHIKLGHAKKTSSPSDQIAVLELTCRGPIDSNHSYQKGIELGHESIVQTFTEITSAAGHTEWGKT